MPANASRPSYTRDQLIAFLSAWMKSNNGLTIQEVRAEGLRAGFSVGRRDYEEARRLATGSAIHPQYAAEFAAETSAPFGAGVVPQPVVAAAALTTAAAIPTKPKSVDRAAADSLPAATSKAPAKAARGKVAEALSALKALTPGSKSVAVDAAVASSASKAVKKTAKTTKAAEAKAKPTVKAKAVSKAPEQKPAAKTAAAKPVAKKPAAKKPVAKPAAKPAPKKAAAKAVAAKPAAARGKTASAKPPKR